MRLALFFTRGVSLAAWVEGGLLGREKLLYGELLKRGICDEIVWVTYGDKDEELAARLHASGELPLGIRVLGMPRLLASYPGRMLWSLVAPLVHWRDLRRADILKTNQMDGAWTALVGKALLRRPLLVRTGFTLSQFEANGGKASQLRIRLFRCIERLCYRFADAATVASQHDRRYLETVLGARNVDVVPNFIDVSLFRPLGGPRQDDRMVFIGRLHPQKNLPALVACAAQAGMGLDLYGVGPEEASLRDLSARLAADVRFLGTVPNAELPGVLNRYRIFALPSLFEGMPKALLEAMACGCACLGTNVPGISEVIRDGENGVLARDTSAEALAEGLRRLRSESDLKELGLNATNDMVNNYSLSAVIRKETDLYARLLGKGEQARDAKASK
ncbi:glycosyl transferase group 1 [Desulfovibrio sp. X2]|uniref:glycosyltransferase family 4 protein n=1 Tax=Desulfovibrio sp. X2 TaxID=941449 RepID=UPI000358C2B6|nr:glycosyltransferase family 4 protein [Desulfovibrio sp. X2]EPR37154.1 glycosyl transferase group 1 [Desulfovibrio sp. X2]